MYMKNNFKVLFFLIISIVSVLPSQSKTFTSSSSEISISIDNLGVFPASIMSSEDVNIVFNYTFSLTGYGNINYFKAKDTIVVETNFETLLGNHNTIVIEIFDNAENYLGDVIFNNNKMMYIVSEIAESLRFASLFGEIHTEDIYNAPYVSTATTYSLKVENQITSLLVNPLPVKLKLISSGLGTTTWSVSQPTTATITLVENESISITATPDTDTNLHYINLGKANGENIYLWNTLTKESQTVTVSYSDLTPGTNEVRIQFSDRKVEVINPGQQSQNWGQASNRFIFTKDVWGIDWLDGLASANNDIYINENGICQLYQTNGATINENYLITNVFFEDSLPGNEDASLRGGQPLIYAVLPWYETRADGGHNAFSPERGRYGDWNARTGAAGQTNLVADSLLTKVLPSSTDTKNTFREKVKNTPLSYGVFKDPVTLTTWIFANLGSPGDPNGPGFKCSELWPNIMSSDPILNMINGDNNCVGGKVQYFRIRFYTQYKNKYTSCYKNLAYISYNYATKDGGVNRVVAAEPFAGANYCISRNPFQFGKGLAYSVTIENIDAMQNSVSISGSSFKLQRMDNGIIPNWTDYASFEATNNNGITKIENLVPGYSYRIVQTNVPVPYDLSFGTQYSTIPGSMRNVSSVGVFEINITDTVGVLVLAKNKAASLLEYNANGGSGNMEDSNFKAVRNSTVYVAQPTYKYDGFVFDSWNTNPDGSGTSYRPKQAITLTDGLTILYAQWIPSVTNTRFGKKTLEGGSLTGYDFSFLVTQLKEDGSSYVKDESAQSLTIQNNVNGDLYLSSSRLIPGKWYHIKEIEGTDTEIKYDTTNYAVYFTLNRTMEYHKCYISDETYKIGSLIAESAVVFTNKLSAPIDPPTPPTPTAECKKAIDYERNEYQSVQIGNLCWTTSNLRSKKYSNGRDIKNVMSYQSNMYPNIEENVDIYGYLYDWYSAIDTTSNGVSPNSQVQGICPEGWYLPTEQQLSDLRSRDVLTLNSPNYWIQNSGNNETGFNALPSGRFNAQTKRFEDLGINYWFHTCSPVGLSDSKTGNISYFCTVLRVILSPLNDGYSVRCVKNL